MTQLGLPFSHHTNFAVNNFVVTPSNKLAFDWIEKWPQWPSHGLFLWGPKMSGKTHLAHIWQTKAKAHFVPKDTLHTSKLEELDHFIYSLKGQGFLFICEDIDTFIEDSPRPFLHLYNLAKENKGYLLCTAQTAPTQWNLSLKDLDSRLKSIPPVTITPPDDDLVRGILQKRLADLQLRTTPAVIEYILNHMDRSFEAVQEVIVNIQHQLEKNTGKLSIPLIKKILAI